MIVITAGLRASDYGHLIGTYNNSRNCALYHILGNAAWGKRHGKSEASLLLEQGLLAP